MTICIGIVCEDGVVVAADSEESYGPMKVHQQKVMTFETPGRACAITGAGDGGYIDAVSIELGEIFATHPKSTDAALLTRLKKCVSEFYRDHVITFASYPEDDRPNLSLLLAMKGRHVPALFTTERTTIRPTRRFQAIGAGEALAKTLFTRLAGSHMNIRAAQVLATYLLFAVKDSITGCGKYTQVFTVHGDGAPLTQLTVQEIGDLERLFRLWYAPYEHSNWWRFIGQYVKVSGPTLEILATTPSASRKRKGQVVR